MPQESIDLALPEELEEVPDEPLGAEELKGIGRSPRTFIMTPKAYEWLRSLGLEGDQDLRRNFEKKFFEEGIQLSFGDVRPIVEAYVKSLEMVSQSPIEEESAEYLPSPRPGSIRSVPPRTAPARSARASDNDDRIAHIECPCGREFWMS